jgi:hypothetical protein
VVAAVASGRGGKGTGHLEHPRSRSCSSLATAPRESSLQPLDLVTLLLFHTTPTLTRLSSQRRRKEGGPCERERERGEEREVRTVRESVRAGFFMRPLRLNCRQTVVAYHCGLNPNC